MNTFICCGAADPPCKTFGESCKNPDNYPDSGLERAKGIVAAWDAINALIQIGPLPEPQHERRNGLVLAANAVMDLMSESHAKYAEDIPVEQERR